ncbi:Bug family tripartite tricarboxylate transporter substrate binding protein [Aquabacter spiritensis]|uniref:Tripartite-type tricarboxylate transporter receptor subunit TctC n=1 Tax=Aquabacter spiritensis TaxID=933073 RepID=A0A4R3LZX5_9HYPH|nr:tripartite tricarboxylate transporter substrate binding protein [Aquabacter spiritensis]TCT04355.1 tripartite-type tricarboxylate transporter receptor subunit TctC [Aquabacter spiritensis]
MRLTSSLRAIAAVALALAGSAVQAAEWKPERAIRLVVPFGPGGATDLVARVLAANMSVTLGQPVVIENRAGAGGVTGTAAVKDAAPDGYTLLVATIGFSANPALFRFKKLPFDPLKDFTFISQLDVVPTILVVPPSLGVTTAQGFIDLAKANPDKITFGSAGYGTINHLAGELVKAQTGVKIVHVPYRSGGQSVAAVVSGEISALFATTPTAAGYVKSGTLVPLATSGANRVPMLPDVPPMSKTIPGFDVVEWQGIVGPAGMQKNVVDTLHAAIITALKDPGVVKKLADLGAETVGSTPAEFQAFVKQEVKMWFDVAEKTGMQAED